MAPICEVERERYATSGQERVAVSCAVSYIGRGMRLEETRALVNSSDWNYRARSRESHDNGRTWSDWELLYEERPRQGDVTESGGASQRGTGPYDPVSGMLIKPVFQRLLRGDPREALHLLWTGERRFADHGFYQLSADDGRTWGEARLLKYESGPDFDPEDWGDPTFFRRNEMYVGRPLAASNGTVVISATVPVPYRDAEDERVPVVFPNTYREGCVAGVICFVGRWDAAAGDYRWQISQPIFLPRRTSTRGLVELDLSELSDGRLLLIMRGSNAGLDPLECPGRKWCSTSSDGGLTWTPITDLRYDDGGQFSSPATFAKTIRATRTGRLYCVLNIAERPAEANAPRHPLQIAEIDEQRVALKRDTVTAIDRREPEHDADTLQLTNFSLLENRESRDLELYLTRLGAKGGGRDVWSADAYHYRLLL